MSQNRAHCVLGKRPLIALRRLAARALWLLLPVFLLPARPCPAQQETSPFVLDQEDGANQYTLALAGTVGTESFQGVRGLLTISFPPPGNPNPYLVIVVGFPTANTRNSFYWDSQQGSMEAMAGSVRCRLPGRGLNLSANHFFYLSPALFARPGPSPQYDPERQKHVEQTALPIKIAALDGEMTINVNGNALTGHVTMTGLDPVGHTYVRYAATFVGQRNQGLSTKR